MSRPQLPPKVAGVALAIATRNYANAPDGDGIFISNEIINAEGYNTLIITTMPENEVEASSAAFDLKVQAYDDLTAEWYDIAGASLGQITADKTSPIDLIIGPFTAVANRVISRPVPHRTRVHVTISTATTDGYDFGVGYELHQA